MITVQADAADVTAATFEIRDRRVTESQPKPVYTELTLSAFVSTIDGATVLQIDTPADLGRFRIYVNDGLVFDADPETGRPWERS